MLEVHAYVDFVSSSLPKMILLEVCDNNNDKSFAVMSALSAVSGSAWADAETNKDQKRMGNVWGHLLGCGVAYSFSLNLVK